MWKLGFISTTFSSAYKNALTWHFFIFNYLVLNGNIRKIFKYNRTCLAIPLSTTLIFWLLLNINLCVEKSLVENTNFGYLLTAHNSNSSTEHNRIFRVQFCVFQETSLILVKLTWFYYKVI